MNTSSDGWIIAAAAAAVFVVDLLTPLGIAVPMLYVVPILLTWLVPGSRITTVIAGCSLLMTLLGIVFSPGEITIAVVANRAMATALLLVVAWQVIHQKQLAQLRDAVYEAQSEVDLRYRAIFQEAGVGVAQLDSRTGQFLEVNRKYCEIVGLTEDEMLATTFMSITHPDDLAEDLGSMEGMQSGELSDLMMEKRYLKKDGSIVWVILNVMPLWRAGEKPSRHIAVVQDITERKQAEESLQKAQNLLQETEKIGHVGGWEFDIDTGKQTWTDGVYRIHEVSRDFEPSVDNGIAFYAPDSKPTIERVVQRAIEAGEPFDVELEFITAKGNRRWVHAIGKRDLQGRRVHGFFQDITERKQMEEALRRLNEMLEQRVAERTAALRETEERFRGIFEHAAEGIAVTDLEGRFVQCNAAYAAIVGHTESELRAMHLQSLIYPDDRPQNMELVRRVMSGQVTSFGVENRYITKSGAPVWVYKHGSILRDDQGTPTHLMVLATDITQRKRDEEELRRQRARLEDLAAKLLTAQEDERRRIARELHDDLTQRMAALAIDLQSIRPLTPGFEASLVAPLHRAGKMAEQLTTDLQRLAHQLHPSLLEHAGLEAAAQELGEEFETRTGLKTEIVVRNLPAALSLDRATCLYRVLQESLQNVRKHAKATHVLVRLLGTRRGVGLCIRDDGEGFNLGQETSGGRKGLGLVSLQERVGVLHGTFRVKSERGEGTGVHAWVPLEPQKVSEEVGAGT